MHSSQAPALHEAQGYTQESGFELLATSVAFPSATDKLGRAPALAKEGLFANEAGGL
jgi:hypothetical protein